MGKQPMVSVIIPVYNVEQYLNECMESIVKQTYTNLDIVLVDDGSKDSSPQMCDDYGKQDERVQVLHKENGGLPSAWKAGVGIAKGEYLVFVDSDDWMELNMIEELVKQTTGIGKEIICSNYIMEKMQQRQSVKVKQSMKPGIYNRTEIETELFPEMLGQEERRIHASRCMKLISKELIVDNMHYVDPAVTMGEDLNIMFPALLDAQRVVVLEEGFFYHYRFVDASMAHKYNAALCHKIEILYQALQRVIMEKIEEKTKKEALLQNLKKEYIFLMFLVLKNELRGPEKNCIKRIKNIIKNAKKNSDVGKVIVEVNNKANWLLYKIWKRPGVVNILVTRCLISIFDRR